MVAAVQAFHDKHDFNARGGEDLVYRVALMSEELGEIAAAVTKGHKSPELNEENLEIPKKPRLNSRHSATGSCGTMASDEVRSLK